MLKSVKYFDMSHAPWCSSSWDFCFSDWGTIDFLHCHVVCLPASRQKLSWGAMARRCSCSSWVLPMDTRAEKSLRKLLAGFLICILSSSFGSWETFFSFLFFWTSVGPSLFSMCLMCVYLNVTMISSLQSLAHHPFLLKISVSKSSATQKTKTKQAIIMLFIYQPI